MGDREFKFREIAGTLKISQGSVFTILHESLRMQKLFLKWMPRLLALNQKQQRVEDSERCLELFLRNKKNFLRQYVTINETGIHHYTPETKKSPAEWTAAGENCPKRPKTQQWAGKVMASVFWDAHDILFIDCLEKSKTIYSDYYIAKQTMFKLNELSFELLPQPRYSPHLAPSDYWLFGDLKKMLHGKRLGFNGEVIAETEAYFKSKDELLYKKGIEKLEKRWNEWITLERNYVDEQCRISR